MKSTVLDYCAIMKIAEREKAKRERRHSRHIKCQNFAARNGYGFWNRIFKLLKY